MVNINYLKNNFRFWFGKYDKWYAGVEYENQDAITTKVLLTSTMELTDMITLIDFL